MTRLPRRASSLTPPVGAMLMQIRRRRRPRPRLLRRQNLPRRRLLRSRHLQRLRLSRLHRRLLPSLSRLRLLRRQNLPRRRLLRSRHLQRQLLNLLRRRLLPSLSRPRLLRRPSLSPLRQRLPPNRLRPPRVPSLNPAFQHPAQHLRSWLTRVQVQRLFLSRASWLARWAQ